jgi:MFS family permease
LSAVFLRLWLGQWISNLGTQISLFGLGLWLFKSDGQLGSFALVAVVVQLSRLLVMRVLVRRLEHWPRRRVLLAANAVGAAGTLALACTVFIRGADTSVWAVLPFLAVAAAAEAALVLSFSTLIPVLVAPDQRGQANGLFATADGLAAMLAPFLGALLAAWAGLAGVVVLDALTFVIALGCVSLGRWPSAALRPLVDKAAVSSPGAAGLRVALVEVLGRPQLRSLLLLGAALMLAFAAAEILFPVWVLALPSGPSRLASALGLSALAYGAGLVLWQWLAQRPFAWPWLFRLGLMVQALVLIGAGIPGISQQLWIWYAGVAAFNLAVPLVLAAQQNLWQRWTPLLLQPRLFAARYAIDWMARLVAVSLVGPVVDRWLRPVLGGSAPGAPMALALALVGGILVLMLLLHIRPVGP